MKVRWRGLKVVLAMTSMGPANISIVISSTSQKEPNMRALFVAVVVRAGSSSP